MNRTRKTSRRHGYVLRTLIATLGTLPLWSAQAGAAVETNTTDTPAAMFPLNETLSLYTYSPNVIRRFDPATGEQMTKATVDEGAEHLIGDSLPDSMIDGSLLSHCYWRTKEDQKVQVTLDLGEVYRLGRVDVNWAGLRGKPERCEFLGSVDGVEFAPLERVDDPLVKNVLAKGFDLPASPQAVWPIRPTHVRYLRLKMNADPEQSPNLLGITEVRAYIDATAPPPTTDQGYNLLALTNPTFEDLTRDHQGKSQWGVFHPMAEGTGMGGSSEATADAVALLDLKSAYPVVRLQAVIGIIGAGPDTWAYGGKIECSMDGETWNTVIDTREPMGGTLAFDLRDSGPVRFVRVTNYHAEGKGTGTGRFYKLELIGGRENPRDPDAFRIGTVKVPESGTLSAGIYDVSGQLIRTLLKAIPVEAGAHALYWDRLDDLGQPADPDAAYTWKALTGQVETENTGSVGQSAEPPYGDDTYDSRVSDMVCDTNDDLYRVAYWDERHHELRRLTPDGHYVWGRPQIDSRGVTVDDQYVYAATCQERDKQNRIYRYDKADGNPAPFAGGYNFFPVGEKIIAPGDLNGMTVDDKWLFVSHSNADKVMVFDKETGEELASFPLRRPVGIALQRAVTDEKEGILWVVNREGDDPETDQNRVTAYAYDRELNFKPKSSITGLDGASHVAIGGPDNDLYVTERHGFRQYSLGGELGPKLTGLKEFGADYAPGPVSDDTFALALSIAVDSQGRISVGDPVMYRIQRFHPDGRLWQSLFAEFQPAPTVAPHPEPERHRVLSGRFEYEVDVSGARHPDWLGDGTWRLANFWFSEDGRFFDNGKGYTVSVRRSLPDTDGKRRDFIIALDGYNAVFYEIGPNGRGLRRSVIVGGEWKGPKNSWPMMRPHLKEERTAETGWLGRYVWTDLNGNGEIDSWGNKQGPLETEMEIAWENSWPCFSTLAPGRWIDENGDIWFADCYPTDRSRWQQGVAGKLPLLGFDDQGNPKYDWNAFEIVVPQDTSPWKFNPTNIRTTSNGDIYMIGKSPIGGPRHPALWMGGGTVACYAADGVRKFIVRLQGADVSVMAPDPDGDSGFWYTGHVGRGRAKDGYGHYITMYNRDGLVAAILKPGAPNDYYASWMDHGWSMYPYIQPETGDRYLYAEDVLFGKSLQYRVRNTESLNVTKGVVPDASKYPSTFNL